MSGAQFEDPNRQAVGLDPAWVEGEGGPPGEPVVEPQVDEADEAEQTTELPGRHAGLDDLAAERGHTWSRDDLTVAEKQAELGG